MASRDCPAGLDQGQEKGDTAASIKAPAPFRQGKFPNEPAGHFEASPIGGIGAPSSEGSVKRRRR